VAHAFNEVRYLLCRLDRAFYERQAAASAGGGAASAGRPSFGGPPLAGF